jgi:PIN domain nuclease of toxin-antitoxin system
LRTFHALISDDRCDSRYPRGDLVSLFSDPRLGTAASAFIDETIAKGDHIGVSAITLAEMVYLVEKGRIPPYALSDLHAAIADPKTVLQHVPLDENVAMKMREVSRQDIPDLPDRVIAATAQLRGVPVLSRDGQIRSSTIQTIW